MDLAPFGWINPCGYEGLQPAQLADLLDRRGDATLLAEASERLVGALLGRLL